MIYTQFAFLYLLIGAAFAMLASRFYRLRYAKEYKPRMDKNIVWLFTFAWFFVCIWALVSLMADVYMRFVTGGPFDEQ